MVVRFDGLVQDCNNFNALAMKLLYSCKMLLFWCAQMKCEGFNHFDFIMTDTQVEHKLHIILTKTHHSVSTDEL